MSEQAKLLRVGQVFVAGGLPTVTYNPRSQLRLEQQVEDYLDERHRILSVSGPTKTGKTVLVKNVLKDAEAVWTSGGAVRSAADLWDAVADELGVQSSSESSWQSTDTESRTTSGELGIPSIAKATRAGQEMISFATTDKVARNRHMETAARKGLRSAMRPLVIDDFHYIPVDQQLAIVRSLKDLVFDGVPVIVIAVPHRAYDVVRVEKEMTGRVQQLEIGFWSNDELLGIAEKGFEALNLHDEGGVISRRLAEESFASPHLMQDFCLNVVKANDIRNRQTDQAALVEPHWRGFFEERSSAASKTAFDMLARGPRQRTDRKPRTLKNGLVVDIYGAVLMAIGYTGPLTSVSYENVRAAMREIVLEDPPRGQEIARVLDEMSKIAREQLEGEPVVDYDSELTTLYISDPYFAFFLRWRAQEELSKRAESIKHTFSGKTLENLDGINVGIAAPSKELVISLLWDSLSKNRERWLISSDEGDHVSFRSLYPPVEADGEPSEDASSAEMLPARDTSEESDGVGGRQ
ncbi:AAA family ATPase [Micromonospora taraxaci]|uniref:AAA family ATPase n=1 Tax=Micromonospora taraxaci TaxID=1316803 RepID=UPI0033E7CC48